MAKSEKPESEAPAPKKAESKFSKDQLLKSKRYLHQHDILDALLDAGKTYSHAEVEKITNDFLKERVK